MAKPDFDEMRRISEVAAKELPLSPARWKELVAEAEVAVGDEPQYLEFMQQFNPYD